MSNALYNFHDSSLPGVVFNKSARKQAKEGKSTETYDDDRAADGDGHQHGQGDGFGFEGVHDALIVAVNTSLIRLEYNVRYDGGKCRCGGNTHTHTLSMRSFRTLTLQGDVGGITSTH